MARKISKTIEPETVETSEEILNNEIIEESVEVIEEVKPVSEPVDTKTYVGTAKTCVNIRKNADQNAEIVDVLYSGTTIPVINSKITSGFYKVKGGYVMAEFLDVKEK